MFDASNPIRPDLVDLLERLGNEVVTIQGGESSPKEAILLIQAEGDLHDPFVRLQDAAHAREFGISLPAYARSARGIILVSQPISVLKGEKRVQSEKSKKPPETRVLQLRAKVFRDLVIRMTSWRFDKESCTA